jgi:probable HAF family extracellular repeat protein
VVRPPPVGNQGFLWRDGGFSNLPGLDGGGSFAYDINSHDWIVGYSTGQGRATLWREGLPTDLGALFEGRFSVATGVNDRGQIVGWGYNEAFEIHAILWDNGRMIDLGTLPGGNYSVAMDINDRGVIAGFGSEEGLKGIVWTDRRRL